MRSNSRSFGRRLVRSKLDCLSEERFTTRFLVEAESPDNCRSLCILAVTTNLEHTEGDKLNRISLVALVDAIDRCIASVAVNGHRVASSFEDRGGG